MARGSVNMMILLILPILISGAHAMDQYGDMRITRMEAIDIAKEWCEGDAWMISLMKRTIACRDEYMKANPDRQKKMENCLVKHMTEIKVDPTLFTYKPELMNTEEGERNMTCVLIKNDPAHLMGVYAGVWTCMEPGKEDTDKYMTHMSTCMSTKARAEEAAYDKEMAAKGKKA